MRSISAWASAGPYPGRLLSPRTEKTTLTRDRFGDVVETRTVADVAGDAVERTVTGRQGILSSSYLDDPLYRRSVYPLRAWDRPAAYLSPRHESVTRTTNGLDTVETTTADNAVTGDHEVTQRVHNTVTGEDQVIHSVRTPRGERVSATRSLSPVGTSRILFDDLLDPRRRGLREDDLLDPRRRGLREDDLLDPRRRGLREDFLLDDLRTKTFNDRLSSGLSKRSLYLDDPQWRRPRTRIDDPLLARHYYADPLRRYDSLYDPLYRHSALDYPLTGDYRLADPLYNDHLYRRDPLHNDHLYRRTAYAVDDPLYRRSAYLMTDPLYRSLR